MGALRLIISHKFTVSRGLVRKLAMAALVPLYWLGMTWADELRGAHIVLGMALIGLAYGGRRLKSTYHFVSPLLLTAIVYDLQRYIPLEWKSPVHVEAPYRFDQTFFGISHPEGLLTPNEWLQLHTHPILDLITGFFYLAFIPIFVLIAAYFQFWLSRRGTRRASAETIARKASGMMWGFFWLNVLGYLTYQGYSAAPPWYVSLHGLGPARLDTPPNAAGAARFDALVGLPIFSNMYSQSADVFGAIPSLHIAYPLLAAFYAFKFGSARMLTVAFYLMMCFSAVYLNHHYVLDLLWGSAYALLIGWVMDRVDRAKKNPKRKQVPLGVTLQKES